MEFIINYGSVPAKSKQLNRSRCVNFYPVADTREPMEGHKSALSFNTCPGNELFSSGSGKGRGIFKFEGILYNVTGNIFSKVNQDGTRTTLGTLTSSSGKVKMVASYTEILVTVRYTTEAWVYNISTGAFTQVTDTGYPGADDVEFQDGYFIVIKNGQAYLSQSLNALTWTPSNTARPSAQGGTLRAILSYKDELVCFFNDTTQYFYNSGASFPFAQRRGATTFNGIIAPESAARVGTNIFYLGKSEKGTACIIKLTDYTPTVVSTEAFAEQISKLENYPSITDAFAFAYEYKTHIFYQITFPSAGKTWVYDDKTRLLHERESLTSDGMKLSRHMANNLVDYNGQLIIDDYQSGNLYKLNDEIYTENNQQITGYLVSIPISQEDKYIQMGSLQVLCSNGKALATGQGSDPQLALAISRNNKAFTAERFASIGKEGEYDARTKFNRLGTARTWVFKLTYAEPGAMEILKIIAHGLSDTQEGDS